MDKANFTPLRDINKYRKALEYTGKGDNCFLVVSFGKELSDFILTIRKKFSF